jgi:hypothetical protein
VTYLDCDQTCPLLVVSYMVPSCILQLKVDKFGPKLDEGDLSSLRSNFSIFGHKLDMGVTYRI